MKHFNRRTSITLVGCVGAIFITVILWWATKLPFSPSTGNIAVGVASGMIAWFLTHFAADFLDGSTRRKANEVWTWVKERFPHHEELTEHILNVVKEKWLSLVNANRENVDSEYYKTLFRNCRRVQISGIACRALVDDLLEETPHPIIQMLQSKEDVVVDIMFAAPDSDFVSVRDDVERHKGLRKKPCSNDIYTTIGDLAKFANRLKGTQLNGRNSLVVKLTKAPLSCSMTHVITNEKETLLWGPLFHHSLGQHSPLYEVPRTEKKVPLEETLFEICLKSFDSQFQNAEVLLTWSKEGIEMNDYRSAHNASA